MRPNDFIIPCTIRMSAICFIALPHFCLLSAQTILAEDSTLNKTFLVDQSPYIVEKDIVIAAGGTVVIGEGCRFFFKPFTGIIVHGNLTINGNNEHPVLFTSINDSLSPKKSDDLPNPFDWNGIYISPQAGRIELSDFILKYSVYGIKSQKESFIIRNGYFKNNGQYHCTIQDQVKPVGEGIPYVYENYAVTYDANGATSGSSPIDSLRYNEGNRVNIPDNSGNLSKPGYAFSGWNSMADGSGSDYAVGSAFSMGTYEVKLYAKWLASNSSPAEHLSSNSGFWPTKGVPAVIGGAGVVSGVVSLLFLKRWIDNRAAYAATVEVDEQNHLKSIGKRSSEFRSPPVHCRLLPFPQELHFTSGRTTGTAQFSSQCLHHHFQSHRQVSMSRSIFDHNKQEICYAL